MKARTLFLYMLLMNVGLALSQRMQTIPNFDKLPGPVVHQFLQDEEGYMWYATAENGLVRDNGYQLEVFNGNSVSLFVNEDNFINNMSLSSDHKILFGTATGAWVLDKTDYSVQRLDSILTAGREVQSVVEDVYDSTYWVASGSTVLHLGRDRRLISSFDIKENGRRQLALAFFQDSQKRLWLLLNQGGMRRYDRSNGTFMVCPWDYDASPFVMIEDSVHKCMWVGTSSGGIVKYDDKGNLTPCPVTYGQTIEEREGRGFVFGLTLENNRIWASAMDNLYCYSITSDGNLEDIDLKEVMSSRRKVIEASILDRNGNIWVPGYTPNPFVISELGTSIKHYGVEQMEQLTGYPLIADVVECGQDGFWLLQGRVGLMYYRIADNRLIMADTGQRTLSVRARKKLLRTLDGKGVWAKNEGRLIYAWIEGDRLCHRVDLDLNESILTMSYDDDGSLFIGTDDAIWRYTPEPYYLQRVVVGIGAVRSILNGPDGNLYFISKNRGFGRLTDTGEVITYNSTYDFNCMAGDGDGNIWLSSPSGLVARFNASTADISVDTLASDHHGAVIKSISVDERGHLWMLTRRYVKEYNPVTHSSRVISSSDPSIHMDYFQDMKVRDGLTVFCGAGAICAVSPSADLEKLSSEAKPVVTDIDIDGNKQHILYGQTMVEVPSSASQVLLYLTTFDFLNAKDIKFAYRLRNRGDETWNYLPEGTNIVQLSGLRRGEFVVEVMATNAQGSWCSPVAVLTINRLPAWWETWWAYLFYIIVVIVLLVWAVRLYLRSQQRKHIEEMEQRLTEMKFRFFTNMSHELRTPLTLIITPLTGIVRQLERDDSPLHSSLKKILGHANDLLKQINNLLSFRKLEMGEMRLHLRYGEMNEFVSAECEAFRPLFERKGVRLSFFHPGTPVNMSFDKNAIHHIIFNLLSNAHKFTPKGGEVSVRVNVKADRANGDKVCIIVSDTGVGIRPEQQRHIFERFYQGDAAGDSSQEGSGIGLNMVSELVALHGGTISVESQVGVGSTFEVVLPKEIQATDSPASQSFVQSTESGEISDDEIVNNSMTEGEGKSSLFTVLVVEDNDEFRQYLADVLSAHFRVLQACNGEEGIQMAMAEQVDVVISDVMMPRIDGFELCHRIKHDERTSYMTVILLTARAGQESELKGYQQGADFYISKPFDIEILMNHLRQVEKQQLQRRQELMLNIGNADIDKLFTDEQQRDFVRRLTDLMNEHIDDSDYKPEALSVDLCMSYVTAYRKVKALTGLTPSEFMRNFRLKRACKYLVSTSYSLTDIAARTGFSSSSYFSRCFQKEYGIVPTDYRKQNTKM